MKYVESLHKLEQKWLEFNKKTSYYAVAYGGVRSDGGVLRFGQWFINNYIKRGTLFIPSGLMKLNVGGPDLYNCRDVEVCREVINLWLVDHHYTTTLPTKL